MPATKRCLATFQPQAWIRDYAVDIDGARKFDITEAVVAMGREAALTLRDNSDPSDDLWLDYRRTHPGEEGTDHNGPFVVNCEDAIAKFYAD